MVRSRVLFALGALLGVGVLVGPGCRTAPAVTLDIRMFKSELCPNIGGTAIVVGSERAEAEERATNYITAETRDCDAATGSIGTLVLTRGPTGRSAVVVVVAFDRSRARTAAECRPPLFSGCVVARRFFAHPEDRDLRLPITIDPACVDVPCNATSTCRRGNCYDSTTIDAEEPGDDGRTDGGPVSNVDGGDAPGDGGGAGDGASEGGPTEGGEGGGDEGNATCDNAGVLFCGGMICPLMQVCCGNPTATCTTGVCAAGRRCCKSTDCPGNTLCALKPNSTSAGICLTAPEP